jgi:hypothetical protein
LVCIRLRQVCYEQRSIVGLDAMDFGQLTPHAGSCAKAVLAKAAATRMNFMAKVRESGLE